MLTVKAEMDGKHWVFFRDYRSANIFNNYMTSVGNNGNFHMVGELRKYSVFFNYIEELIKSEKLTYVYLTRVSTDEINTYRDLMEE